MCRDPSENMYSETRYVGYTACIPERTTKSEHFFPVLKFGPWLFFFRGGFFLLLFFFSSGPRIVGSLAVFAYGNAGMANSADESLYPPSARPVSYTIRQQYSKVISKHPQICKQQIPTNRHTVCLHFKAEI